MANVDSIAVAPADPDPTPPSGRPARRPSVRRVPGPCAGGRRPAVLTDGAVLAFALFTVLYHLAFLGDLRPSVTFRIWLLACVALAVVALLRARRRHAEAPPRVRMNDRRRPSRPLHGRPLTAAC
ncbi:hypothetical protein NKG94_20100 [Micromonospora sp. M12]